MEIAVVEPSDFLKVVSVRQHDERAASLDTLLGAKRLQSAVDMDGGEAGSIRNLVLRKRKRQILNVNALCGKPCRKLA